MLPFSGGGIALTGIPYFDKKIKDGTLSAYDAYLANKYLGLNLTNSNTKSRLKCDLNNAVIIKILKELNLISEYMDNTDEVLKYSHLAGTRQGLETWLNKITGGWWSLDFERQKLNIATSKVIDAIAYIINNGKITNESRKDAREIFGVAGFTSQKELVARTTQARQTMLNRIDILLAILEEYECPNLDFYLNN